MILLIDNYDSFVHNLARYFNELGCETCVVRNDAISLAEIQHLAPDAIVLSPGPCTPNEAGVGLELVQCLSDQFPMLGVCLGHQTIAAALGANVVTAPQPVHGRESLIRHNASRLFHGLPNPLKATRYHSLVVDERSLPTDLVATAHTEDGDVLMAIEHRSKPVFGVQFHPESVLTETGHQLLANFLAIANIDVSAVPDGDLVGSDTDHASTSKQLPQGQPLHW